MAVGSLAATGAGVTWWVVAALVPLVAGLLLVHAARRHRTVRPLERRTVTKEILLLAGTRPEAVKIAPVALALADHAVLRPTIVHSGQHADMVDQALEAFGLKPDVVLDVPRSSGGRRS